MTLNWKHDKSLKSQQNKKTNFDWYLAFYEYKKGYQQVCHHSHSFSNKINTKQNTNTFLKIKARYALNK